MHLTRTLGIVLSAAVLAPTALAAGEPKNQPPFTRPVDGTALVRGEPKNDVPFTRPAEIVVEPSGGFAWTEATIGATAGAGAALAALGAVALFRRPPREAAPGVA
jgi:hypothetical protein